MDASAYNISFDSNRLSILYADYVKRRDALGDEDTKLRELVRELWTYAEQELLCDENCPYGAVCDWRDCVFKRRMRELGVEVDG